jgi:nucleotide-binding universal stress UspA family protein
MMEPIVVGTDGSNHADIAVEWAADEAVRHLRPLHIVHAAEHYDIPAERVLTEAMTRAEKNRPELAVTGEMIIESPAYAMRVAARRAFEIVVGHRGYGGFDGMLLGSTGLRAAGHADGPVIVVRGEATERYREVVVGVDGPADAALRYAFCAAAARGAWLRAVHTWLPPQRGYPVAMDRASGAAAERLAEVLAAWRERYPDVRVIEQAPSGHAISELAERSALADLLVVGSRAAMGPHGLFLGPVACGAIHHARCPVAVVRPVPRRSQR